MSSWKSVFRNDLLTGKVALVTGGGTGIGKAIATEFACLGATVVIASRNVEKCQEAAQEINARSDVTGRVHVGPSTSLKKEDEIKALIEYCVSEHKRLDILINNAGGQFISPIDSLSARGFAAVIETNLNGTFLMCREAYTQYMQEHGGSIVNITLGNRNGMPMLGHSGAARAGVENLTKTLCLEWMNAGVRVNCVRPGIIYTDSGFAAYGDAGEYFLEKIVPSIPAKRLGSPEEISSAVVWLISPGANYVTGTTINVDGGGSYTMLPLVEIEDKQHLPLYGTLPTKARL